MGLFGKAKEPARAHTNAPRDWPPVSLKAWTGNPGLDSIMVFGDIVPGLTSAGGRVAGMLDRRLYDDGVLTVPLALEVAGQRFAVFVYSKADEESAAHYSSVRSVLRQREQTTAVYYAPGPILPARPSGALEPLGPGHFVKASEERPPAEYALFWPSPEDPALASSPALGFLDRFFSALDGRFYVYLTMLAREIELGGDEDDQAQVYALPAQPLVVGLEGPGEIGLYLHASEKGGLWFACDTRTPAPLRNLLLKHLAQSAEMLRAAADERGAPRRDEEKGILARWREVRDAFLRQEEEGAAGLRLGLVSEQGTARVIASGVTSAESRQALSSDAEPAEALLDLVRTQLDHAFAQVRRVAGSAEEGPNLMPFVAVQAGADLWRTVLPFTVEPEAAAVAPRLLGERPGGERAVLVCDGYLRVEGQRSDALVVRAQERSDAGSFVFAQRYRVAKGKVELLGNWLLTGREASLWPATLPPQDVHPSPGLRSFAEERLRERLRWMGLGDPEGPPAGDEALLSPRLEWVKDGKSYTSAFMMMSVEAALGASREALASEAACSLASLEWDDLTTRNGRPERSASFLGARARRAVGVPLRPGLRAAHPERSPVPTRAARARGARGAALPGLMAAFRPRSPVSASAAGGAEAAAAAVRVVDPRGGGERGPLDPLHEQLGHAVPERDAEGCVAVVHEDDPDLAPVVAVDDAGERVDPVADREPAARPDEPDVARRDLEPHAGGHGGSAAGDDLHRLARAQVGPRRSRRGVLGKRGGGVEESGKGDGGAWDVRHRAFLEALREDTGQRARVPAGVGHARGMIAGWGGRISSG